MKRLHASLDIPRPPIHNRRSRCFSSLAKALLDRPSAAPRIIRARSAWRCSVRPERTILSSSALSSAVIASAVLLAHMPHRIAGPKTIVNLCLRHYTSEFRNFVLVFAQTVHDASAYILYMPRSFLTPMCDLRINLGRGV